MTGTTRTPPANIIVVPTQGSITKQSLKNKTHKQMLYFTLSLVSEMWTPIQFLLLESELKVMKLTVMCLPNFAQRLEAERNLPPWRRPSRWIQPKYSKMSQYWFHLSYKKIQFNTNIWHYCIIMCVPFFCQDRWQPVSVWVEATSTMQYICKFTVDWQVLLQKYCSNLWNEKTSQSLNVQLFLNPPTLMYFTLNNPNWEKLIFLFFILSNCSSSKIKNELWGFEPTQVQKCNPLTDKDRMILLKAVGAISRHCVITLHKIT